MTQAIVELRSAVRPHLAHLSAGDRILVAVSGGADSLALAGALLVEAKEFLITCIGVTIDLNFKMVRISKRVKLLIS